ncbi:MAG TPA: hypothetical protein PKG95_12585 [Anaerolineaceae bacterium]|nr:hypothetical protein [Anaerolineaceae bacterium]
MDISAQNAVGGLWQAPEATPSAMGRLRPSADAASLETSHEALLARARQADRAADDAETIARARWELNSGLLDTEPHHLLAADILLKFGI